MTKEKENPVIKGIREKYAAEIDGIMNLSRTSDWPEHQAARFLASVIRSIYKSTYEEAITVVDELQNSYLVQGISPTDPVRVQVGFESRNTTLDEVRHALRTQIS